MLAHKEVMMVMMVMIDRSRTRRRRNSAFQVDKIRRRKTKRMGRNVLRSRKSLQRTHLSQQLVQQLFFFGRFLILTTTNDHRLSACMCACVCVEKGMGGWLAGRLLSFAVWLNGWDSKELPTRWTSQRKSIGKISNPDRSRGDEGLILSGWVGLIRRCMDQNRWRTEQKQNQLRAERGTEREKSDTVCEWNVTKLSKHDLQPQLKSDHEPLIKIRKINERLSNHLTSICVKNMYTSENRMYKSLFIFEGPELNSDRKTQISWWLRSGWWLDVIFTYQLGCSSANTHTHTHTRTHPHNHRTHYEIKHSVVRLLFHALEDHHGRSTLAQFGWAWFGGQKDA